MKLSKEQLEKLILGVVFGIIVIIILMTLVFGPNLKRIGILRIGIREEREKVVKAEKEIVRFPTVKLNLKRLREEVRQYQVNMPEATPDWLLERLNNLGSETEISFDKIEPRGYITQAGLYWLQGLHIGLRADYHRLGIFINKLENLSPFIKVIDLSITGNKDDIKRHMVKITVGTYVEEK